MWYIASALLIAAAMIEDGGLAAKVKARYAGWDGELGREIRSGAQSLDTLADRALNRNVDTRPVSGRQEAFENLLNRFI